MDSNPRSFWKASKSPLMNTMHARHPSSAQRLHPAASVWIGTNRSRAPARSPLALTSALPSRRCVRGGVGAASAIDVACAPMGAVPPLRRRQLSCAATPGWRATRTTCGCPRPPGMPKHGPAAGSDWGPGSSERSGVVTASVLERMAGPGRRGHGVARKEAGQGAFCLGRACRRSSLGSHAATTYARSHVGPVPSMGDS